MRFFTLLLFFISSISFANLICNERCQHYNGFENRCMYQTECVFENGCVTEISCDHWNSYLGKCHAEIFKTKCTVDGTYKPLKCTESCQHFDDFEKVCRYQTRCRFTDRCVTKTFCKDWDALNKRCIREESISKCL
jgi:ABC-type dipeptide/oligopeptide/nickel transport system ATPase component